MSTTVKNIVKKHFINNLSLYIIVTLSFTIGICTGAFTVNTLNLEQSKELATYLQEFINILGVQSINNVELFNLSIFNNMKTVILLWVLGITVIGIPFILIIIGIKGFVTGFTVAVIIQNLNFKGLLFAFLGIFPQNLIIIPCYIIIGVICIKFSILLFKSIKRHIHSDLKTAFITYSTAILLLLFVLVIGGLIEAYISPILIKSIIGRVK